MPASMPGTLPNPTMPGSSAVLMPVSASHFLQPGPLCKRRGKAQLSADREEGGSFWTEWSWEPSGSECLVVRPWASGWPSLTFSASPVRHGIIFLLVTSDLATPRERDLSRDTVVWRLQSLHWAVYRVSLQWPWVVQPGLGVLLIKITTMAHVTLTCIHANHVLVIIRTAFVRCLSCVSQSLGPSSAHETTLGGRCWYYRHLNKQSKARNLLVWEAEQLRFEPRHSGSKLPLSAATWHTLPPFPQQSYEVCAVLAPILQMRKPSNLTKVTEPVGDGVSFEIQVDWLPSLPSHRYIILPLFENSRWTTGDTDYAGAHCALLPQDPLPVLLLHPPWPCALADTWWLLPFPGHKSSQKNPEVAWQFY